MPDLPTFSERIGRFSRYRRQLLNAATGYRLGTLALIAGVIGLLLLCGLIPGALVNLGLAAAVVVWLLALAITGIRRHVGFRSYLDEAFRMEALVGGLNSRLICAWDFLETKLDTPLTGAVIARAGKDLEGEFEARLDHRPRNVARRRFVLWGGAFVLVAISPPFGVLRAGANLRNAWAAAAELLFPVQYQVTVTPSRPAYKLGEQVALSLAFKRRAYQSVTFVVREGQDERRQNLVVGPDQRATVTLTRDVETTCRVHFAFGERQTPETALVFTTLPVLMNMQTELIYPRYTGMLPRTLEGVQQRLVGLPRTEMTLGFTFSKELTAAKFTFDDGEELPLEVLGRFASVSLLHTRAREGRLQVTDKHQFELEHPVIVTFDLQPDEKPRLFLPKHLQEDMPFKQDGVGLFGFGVRGEDDYGLTRCTLKWQRATVDNPNAIVDRGEIERLVSPPRRKAVADFEKVFANLNLRPGDKVSFQVEVADNRDPDPQKTVSRRCSLFVFQDELGGLSIKSLGFGAGGIAERGRLAKSKRTTSVKAPDALRTRELVRNEFEAAVQSVTRPPTVRGEYGQATRDYFQLLSGVAYSDEEKKSGEPPGPGTPGP